MSSAQEKCGRCQGRGWLGTLCDECNGAGIDVKYAQAQWQPIETAPKDVPILAAWASDGGVHIVYWSDSYGGGWIGHYPETIEPTHWMPLPAPPEAAS